MNKNKRKIKKHVQYLNMMLEILKLDIELQVRHTTVIPIVFNKKPEPIESAIASAMPSPAARIKEVDTDGSSSLPSGQPNNIVNRINEPDQTNTKRTN